MKNKKLGRVLAEEVVPARPSRSAKVSIPRSESDVGFAPVPDYARVCESREGRWRPAHAPEKDGTCVFCDEAVA